MDNHRITKPSEIIEMEILNGIDRLFHQLNVTFGYGNDYSKAYAEALKKMLPGYIDNQFRISQQTEKMIEQVMQSVKDAIDSK